MKKIDIKNLDKKSRMEILATSALVIVFIIILGNSLKSISRPGRPAVVLPQAAKADFKEVVGKKSAITSEIKSQEGHCEVTEEGGSGSDLPWGRDPFIAVDPSQAGNLAVSDLKLEGILWDDKEPHAIINGTIFAKGNRIGKMTIVQISEDAVMVTDGNKQYRLEL